MKLSHRQVNRPISSPVYIQVWHWRAKAVHIAQEWNVIPRDLLLITKASNTVICDAYMSCNPKCSLHQSLQQALFGMSSYCKNFSDNYIKTTVRNIMTALVISLDNMLKSLLYHVSRTPSIVDDERVHEYILCGRNLCERISCGIAFSG